MYIDTDTELREYIPNVFEAAMGEVPLYDKLKNYLKQSEMWLNMNIADHATFGQLLSDGKDDLVCALKRIVAIDAFYRAVPSLDLVLTPNGFGVVQNQNVAPASKERVANLRASLLAERDMCIVQVVQALHGNETWCKSLPGRRFGELIIQSIEVSVECNENVPSFKFYINNRREMLGIQRMLALNFVSMEIMKRLCHSILYCTVTDVEIELIDMIHAYIVESLKEENPPYERLNDMVNYIKANAGDFSEWETSDTALLFEDYSFKNDKEAGGFWL